MAVATSKARFWWRIIDLGQIRRIIVTLGMYPHVNVVDIFLTHPANHLIIIRLQRELVGLLDSVGNWTEFNYSSSGRQIPLTSSSCTTIRLNRIAAEAENANFNGITVRANISILYYEITN